MASFRKHGKSWYYRYTDADGVKRERKGCPDRRETERMAVEAEAEAARIKSGLADPRDVGYKRHEARPLAEHLADWRRDMLARGKTAKHAEQYHERAGKLAALARGARLADLEPGRSREAREKAARTLADAMRSARLSDLASDRIQVGLARLREAGKANQTANHYRAALRAFSRWAWDNGRLRESPMRGVKGFNVEEDRRHERRSLSDDELARLIRAAGSGPDLFGMTGPLRAMTYRLASATGFRAEELRTLTPRVVPPNRPGADGRAQGRLDEEPPDRRAAGPLGPGPRRGGLAQGQAVRFERLPAPPRDGQGDPGRPRGGRHPLRDRRGGGRLPLAASLLRLGPGTLRASIKEVQALARHAKPQTTLNHYAKVSVRDLRRAIDTLPVPDLEESEAGALAATGTSGKPANPSHHFPTGGDGEGRPVSVAVGIMQTGPPMAGPGAESQTLDADGISRPLSVAVVSGAERGGFEPPRRVFTRLTV